MNTSEFARICRTERRTIHYYDAIGLLKPDHVQENGYREYSAEQVEQMDTIRILQSSGYTLKEIQKITAGRERGAGGSVLRSTGPDRGAHPRAAEYEQLHSEAKAPV